MRSSSARRYATASTPSKSGARCAWSQASATCWTIYLASDGFLKKRKSTQRDYRRFAETLRSHLRSRQLKAIARRDIAALHMAMKATPYAANRMLAFTSLLYSYAVREGWAKENIVEHIERYPEDKRERYLTEAELARLHRALEAYRAEHHGTRHQQDANGAAVALELLLLTGSRLGEVLSATWEQFDLERGVWTKPSAHTKQKRLQRLELGDAEWKLLKSFRPADATGPVFVGRNGEDGREGIRRVWDYVKEKARLEGVRLHDLRHTNASVLASLGYSLPVIGKRLGHTQPTTTARYAHLTDKVQREAANASGKKLGYPRKSA